jgi:hypothetical protein
MGTKPGRRKSRDQKVPLIGGREGEKGARPPSSPPTSKTEFKREWRAESGGRWPDVPLGTGSPDGEAVLLKGDLTQAVARWVHSFMEQSFGPFPKQFTTED